MSYDVKCFALAQVFIDDAIHLGDAPKNLDKKKAVDKLANQIQGTIEDFLLHDISDHVFPERE